MQPEAILKKFGLENYSVSVFSNGLINTTWIIENSKGEKEFVLQKINKNVFKFPEDIGFNIRLIADHIKHHHPDYLFTNTIQAIDGKDLIKENQEYFRIFPFLKNSHTIKVAQKPGQAYEAAKQFGKFTKALSALDPSELKITLPRFHDLTYRYSQFDEALQKGNKKKIDHSQELILFIKQQENIVREFEKIRSNPEFKIRVTHHDTKISNVLFDENEKGICVIDLDTVMPGYFISDLGDMMRTYLSPVNEEEKDLTKIEIRKEFFKAITNGYLSEMKDELTATEKKYFVYAGKFMIYMQAIRFITDHLNNDIYYGVKYEGQNYVRAKNQMVLLNHLNEAEHGLMNL